MKAKIISLVLCLSLVLGLMPVTAFAAAGADGSITISATDTSVEIGETVDVTFTVNANTSPVGSVDMNVVLPDGLEYVSHEILVAMTDFMMSSYDPATGAFGCGVTKTGKTGSFGVLKLTLRALDTNVGLNTVNANIVKMTSNLSATLDYGTVEGLDITTSAPVVAVTSVTVTPATVTMENGTNQQLTAEVLPANATDKNVTWSVVDGSAVTVSDTGLVTAVAEGTATVQASAGGKIDTCTITVIKATCKHSGSTTTHDAVASTCKTAGHAEYVTCDACSAVISGSDAPLALDANNHENVKTYPAEIGTCVAPGHAEYKKCEACGVVTSGSDTAVPGPHKWINTKKYEMTPADCNKDAVYYKSCEYCEIKHVSEETWTDTGSKLNHDMAPADCLNPATCKRGCGYTEGVKLGHDFENGEYGMNAAQHWKICARTGCEVTDTAVNHSGMEGDKICDVCGYDANCKHEGTKTTHAAVASTCKTPGHAQYVTCDNCSAVIEGSDAPLALNPDNHTGEGTKLGTNKADPTCSTPGNTGDTLCAGCDAVLQEGTVIPAQHTLTKIPGTAADCTNTGLVDTWKCNGECGKTFIDEAATTEATETNVVIAIDPDAHNWVDGVCQNNTKHVQTVTEVEPGQKAEAVIPETILTIIADKIAEFVEEVKKVIEESIVIDETWSKLFKDGSIGVVEGKLVYELQPEAPEGVYTIEVPVGDNGDVFVAEIVVAEADPGYARPAPSNTTPNEVKKVIKMIDELPSAKKITLTDEENIEEARVAYEALSKANQKKVTNLDKLIAAEEALEALKIPAPEVIDNPFVDVDENAYYADAVLWAVENNITSGTSAVIFSPDAVCTRAQVVTFLWRAAGCPAPLTSDMPFVDVEAGAYYTAAVQWAVENNITSGTSATTFDPNGQCTRGQIVTFLWRSQGNPAAAAVNNFVDVENDAYYAAPILWAVANGVTNGTSATTFSPAADCTRAQVVTFIYRCMAE